MFLIHLLCISSLVGSLAKAPLLSIIQEHLSFHIKCADSSTRIVKSLLWPFFLGLLVLVEFGKLVPRIDPKEMSGHVSSRFVG